eukprot:11195853-Lingulodinium_polyedra.AAC.1
MLHVARLSPAVCVASGLPSVSKPIAVCTPPLAYSGLPAAPIAYSGRPTVERMHSCVLVPAPFSPSSAPYQAPHAFAPKPFAPF